MRTYIVYIRGVEQPDLIKAGSQCSAEKKAAKKYKTSSADIQCVYTEI
jgi:hypothetical protein